MWSEFLSFASERRAAVHFRAALGQLNLKSKPFLVSEMRLTPDAGIRYSVVVGARPGGMPRAGRQLSLAALSGLACLIGRGGVT